MSYKLLNSGSVLRLDDGAVIPPDPRNIDYAVFLTWRDAGNTPAPADAPPAAARPLVLKTVIIERLHDAGKLDAARAALDAADTYTRERWNVRDSIYADDETARALLTAIGADPDAILAPE